MAEQVTRKPYVRDVPRTLWFLRHPRYVRYMAREFSCLFIGAYTLMLVVGLKRLAEGPDAYAGFLAALGSPGAILFQLLALAFAGYHSITWFRLTPKALPVQIGENFVPDRVIAGAHYAGWALLSLVVLWLAGAF
jgi:fumarate reductase subunit C